MLVSKHQMTDQHRSPVVDIGGVQHFATKRGCTPDRQRPRTSNARAWRSWARELLMLAASFGAVSILFKAIEAGAGHHLIPVAVLAGVVEIVFLWRWIWSCLAVAALLVPGGSRAHTLVRSAIEIWGTKAARHTVAGAVTSTVLVGGLVSGAAAAEKSPDAIQTLWASLPEVTVEAGGFADDALVELPPLHPLDQALREDHNLVPTMGGSEVDLRAEPGPQGAPERSLSPGQDSVPASSAAISDQSPPPAQTAGAAVHPQEPSKQPDAASTAARSASSSWLHSVTTGDIPTPHSASAVSPPSEPPLEHVASQPIVAVTATHKVVAGDCLWDIAALNLPVSATDQEVTDLWQSIYDINAEVIGDDPNLIEPGMVLRLPDHFVGRHR